MYSLHVLVQSVLIYGALWHPLFAFMWCCQLADDATTHGEGFAVWPELVIRWSVRRSRHITSQTVMLLSGISPSIQHGHMLWARNLSLPSMIGDWGWGVVVPLRRVYIFVCVHIYIYIIYIYMLYIYINRNRYVCCGTTTFEVDEWPSVMCLEWRVDDGWNVFRNNGVLGGNLGDVGWKCMGN